MIYVGWLGAVVGFAAGAVLTLSRFFAFAKRTVFLISALLVMVAAFTMGYDSAGSYLRYGATNHSIQLDKELEPNPIPVKIIRLGARGILYYEPKSKQLNFVRWEIVKKLASNY